MIDRSISDNLKEGLEIFPAMAILGPRQVGKTTLVKQLMADLKRPSLYLDLEYFADANKLNEPDTFFLEHQDKTIILDEIQRMPELFPLLRSIIDQNRQNGRFILLGSASQDLLKKSSETLAGRILYLEMHPIQYQEILGKPFDYKVLWIRGGYPTPLLANKPKAAMLWQNSFLQTYVERDLPALGLPASPILIRNLLRMVSHIHGGLLTYSDLANSLNVSMPSIKTYLDCLENAFLIRRLEPYFVNIGKRLVKSPKIYIRDSGLLHFLLGIQSFDQILGHPSLGNSWEGFVIQQIIANLAIGVEPYFYRTKDGAELDLLLVKYGVIEAAIEIKFGASPAISRGNTQAWTDLQAKQNLIITPETPDYWYKKNVRVCNLSSMWIYLGNSGLLDENEELIVN
jgi:uncharacterized protein